MRDEGKIVRAPAWALKNLVHSRGIRLPKLERIDVEAEKKAAEIASRPAVYLPRPSTEIGFRGRLPVVVRGRVIPFSGIVRATEIPSQDTFHIWRQEAVSRAKRMKTPSEEGNLPREEYRWWIGAQMPVSSWAICRYCRQAHYGLEARRAHHVMTPLETGEFCKQLLMQAYRNLLQKARCVVCEKVTGSRIWGIPICGDSCERRWMYQYAEHTLMAAAIGHRVPVRSTRVQ